MSNKLFGIVALVGLLYFWLSEYSAQSAPPGPRTLTSSWYEKSKRRDGKTASGQIFNPRALTAASWEFYGKRLRVTGPLGSVEVMVNDKGPAKRLMRTRQIDLSRRAFAMVCPLDAGLIQVTVEIL